MQEDRKGKAARRTTVVLKRNRSLYHGQNNTKKITAISRTKEHEEEEQDSGIRSVGREIRPFLAQSDLSVEKGVFRLNFF